jgi:hypothetical protein
LALRVLVGKHAAAGAAAEADTPGGSSAPVVASPDTATTTTVGASEPTVADTGGVVGITPAGSATPTAQTDANERSLNAYINRALRRHVETVRKSVKGKR